MSNCDPRTNPLRNAGIRVDHSQVLNVGVDTDRECCIITAQYAAKPNGGACSELDVAYESSVIGRERGADA